jgi:hypothetical protein
MISCESPFINISRLLNRLLEPIYDRIAFDSTFFKRSDAIQALETYTEEGHLRSTTLFTTLHIHNILSIFRHQRAIQILKRFLQNNILEKQIQGISIRTILRLVRSVLNNQWFVCSDNFYQ